MTVAQFYRMTNVIQCDPKFLCISLAVFSRVLRDATPRFVGPSVGPSVRLSVCPSFALNFFAVFGLTAPAQMIK